jgi:hypothetical protein
MKIEDYRRKCKNGTVARKSQSLSMWVKWRLEPCIYLVEEHCRKAVHKVIKLWDSSMPTVLDDKDRSIARG